MLRSAYLLLEKVMYITIGYYVTQLFILPALF